jgi:hypothetical protein
MNAPNASHIPTLPCPDAVAAVSQKLANLPTQYRAKVLKYLREFLAS